MVGVGVTSYKRPEYLRRWRQEVFKYSKENEFRLCEAVDDDTQRLGIARNKNYCLDVLSNCEYIFLFDDDCFPQKEGWVDYFISEHERTGQHHFMYLKDTANIVKIRDEKGIGVYNNCAGCFLFLTQEVLKKVGYFNKEYGVYGFEHAGYSERIHRAGLTPFGKYLAPAQTPNYIYSMDYDFGKHDIESHKPSISFKEAKESVQKNRDVYIKEINTIYQPL